MGHGRRSSKTGAQEASEPEYVFAAPEIGEVHWEATAGSIFAGVTEGAQLANKQARGREDFDPVHTSLVSSVATKHTGRSFGACATGHIATRNGMLRLAVPGCPVDHFVRAPDALASIPLTELCSTSQVRLERKILDRQILLQASRPVGHISWD